MATYMPSHQAAQYPHQELPASSPPEQAMFQINSGPQRSILSQMPNGMRNQNRMSGEYRGSALPNGSKAIPTGPQAHGPNGARNFGGPGGGGGFDGPRSPPNAKSMFKLPFCMRSVPDTEMLESRYLSRAMQVLQDRSMSGWESLPISPYH